VSVSLLEVYLNQDVTWTPAQRNADGITKKDGSGRTLYGTAQTIKALVNDKFQMVRDKTGAEIVSSGYAKTLTAVEVDDKLNGRVVISRNIHRDFDGQEEGRTVYLK
jgi:hypothetical protein